MLARQTYRFVAQPAVLMVGGLQRRIGGRLLRSCALDAQRDADGRQPVSETK